MVGCMQLPVESLTGGLFLSSRHYSISAKTFVVAHRSAYLGLDRPYFFTSPQRKHP